MSTNPVPFLDLVTPHRELEEELVAAFREAVRSAAFVGGPQVEAFEREFAEYCGAKYCVGVANGTDAVRFALMASGVGRGDAVVTVSHTFIATVEAISQAGAETEFVDIDERTYCMSADALGEYLKGCAKDPATGRPLGKRTGKPIKAVRAGPPVWARSRTWTRSCRSRSATTCSWSRMRARRRGRSTVQSNGGWRRAGTFGKAAAFSFYPGKNLGSCGEGGAVTTDDEQVAQTIRMLREHGQAQKYYHDLEGYNGRLDAIQAAFLRIKLRHLDAWNAERRAAAATLRRTALEDARTSSCPSSRKRAEAIYHLYVIRTKDRDALGDHLKSQGVFTGLHYPVPLHLQKCYRDWGYGDGQLPGDRAGGTRDPVAADVPRFDGGPAAARRGRHSHVRRA